MGHRVEARGDVEVRSISLGTLVDMVAGAAGRLDLLKVDIEGSEQALLCANPSILRRIDALVVELHPGLCDTEAVRTLLAEHYRTIREIGGRKSSKPLLLCQDNCASTQ
jgi:hypothetical protein